MNGAGLYVHVPFCLQRCPYCAFNAVAGHQEFIPDYVESVIAEIGQRGTRLTRRPVVSVYFGGGTPSLLAPAQVEAILHAARRSPGIRDAAEITLEANPGTVDVARLRAYRLAGVNRLSLGVQSLDDRVLRWLGRTHSAADGIAACTAARSAGFRNLNVDLMFGIPATPAGTWEDTLQRVLILHPEHISTYALTLEEGTALAARASAQRDRGPDEEEDAAAYQQARHSLQQAGYRHYEVSNFALTGRECRHNWSCWHGAEYLGVGAGAHSYLQGVRCWNHARLEDYLGAVQAGHEVCAGQEVIDGDTARRERVWMQLRTDTGVALGRPERQSLQASPRFAALREAGFLTWYEERLCLGTPGWAVADSLGVEVDAILEDSRHRKPRITAYRRGLERAEQPPGHMAR